MTTVPRTGRATSHRRAGCDHRGGFRGAGRRILSRGRDLRAFATSQRVAGKRDIRHERLLRDIRKPPAPSRPRTRQRPRRRRGPPAVDGLRPVRRAGRRPHDPRRPGRPGGPSTPVAPGPAPGQGRERRRVVQLHRRARRRRATRSSWGTSTPTSGPRCSTDLYRLRPGDPVYVDADGTRRRFDVTSVREMPKPSFPVNQVFGSTKRHMLWLITCGGAFDYETRHYLDNIVVSATWDPPAKERPGEKEHAKRSENHQQSVR